MPVLLVAGPERIRARTHAHTQNHARLFLLTLPTVNSAVSLLACSCSPAFITFLLLKVRFHRHQPLSGVSGMCRQPCASLSLRPQASRPPATLSTAALGGFARHIATAAMALAATAMFRTSPLPPPPYARIPPHAPAPAPAPAFLTSSPLPTSFSTGTGERYPPGRTAHGGKVCLRSR